MLAVHAGRFEGEFEQRADDVPAYAAYLKQWGDWENPWQATEPAAAGGAKQRRRAAPASGSTKRRQAASQSGRSRPRKR